MTTAADTIRRAIEKLSEKPWDPIDGHPEIEHHSERMAHRISGTMVLLEQALTELEREQRSVRILICGDCGRYIDFEVITGTTPIESANGLCTLCVVDAESCTACGEKRDIAHDAANGLCSGCAESETEAERKAKESRHVG